MDNQRQEVLCKLVTLINEKNKQYNNGNEKSPIIQPSFGLEMIDIKVKKIQTRLNYYFIPASDKWVLEKTQDDLLDIMNWCAMVYVNLERGEKDGQ